ncbi:MAG: hypothetical protein NXI31_22225 [bacterium]|nr:hypothetical protein [bacterium]
MVSLCAEIFVVQLVLRGGGLRDPNFAGPLVAINLCTWVPFLIAVDRFGMLVDGPSVPVLVALEIGVVLVEIPLLWLSTRGRFCSRRTKWQPIGLGRAVCASAIGNVTSIGVSLLVPILLFLSVS